MIGRVRPRTRTTHPYWPYRETAHETINRRATASTCAGVAGSSSFDASSAMDCRNDDSTPDLLKLVVGDELLPGLFELVTGDDLPQPLTAAVTIKTPSTRCIRRTL